MLYATSDAAGALETLAQHHAWTSAELGHLDKPLAINSMSYDIVTRFAWRCKNVGKSSKIVASCSQGWTRQVIKLC